jgi:hypothetical protein
MTPGEFMQKYQVNERPAAHGARYDISETIDDLLTVDDLGFVKYVLKDYQTQVRTIVSANRTIKLISLTDSQRKDTWTSYLKIVVPSAGTALGTPNYVTVDMAYEVGIPLQKEPKEPSANQTSEKTFRHIDIGE